MPTRRLQMMRFVAAAVFYAATASLFAQTLARPGWVGSGLNAEPWWRNAVFYKIAPALFQDSDGDGKGDLRGIAQRMTYLQSLSVDAIVLEEPFDDAGFDDLLSETSKHHIRVLVAIAKADDGDLIARSRSWLARGCAGIWLRAPANGNAAQTGLSVQALRKLTDSFPGQRVLVEDTSDNPAALALPGAQLVTRTIVDGIGEHTDALSLRVQLGQLGNVPPGSAPVVLLQRRAEQAGEDTKHHEALEKILGSALFLSRGAVALSAGAEIDSAGAGNAGVMRWTPLNVSRSPAAEPEHDPTPPPRRAENDYGTFVPYVAPKKTASSVAPDLNALPGFSAAAIPGFQPDAEKNVATEDANADSLLNFYRKLSQLHHENASLHSGGTTVLNRDAANVLLWARALPRAGGNFPAAIIASNLSDTSVAVSLAPEIDRAARVSGLLPLLSSSPVNVQVLQRPTEVSLAPWSVVVLSPDR